MVRLSARQRPVLGSLAILATISSAATSSPQSASASTSALQSSSRQDVSPSSTRVASVLANLAAAVVDSSSSASSAKTASPTAGTSSAKQLAASADETTTTTSPKSTATTSAGSQSASTSASNSAASASSPPSATAASPSSSRETSQRSTLPLSTSATDALTASTSTQSATAAASTASSTGGSGASGSSFIDSDSGASCSSAPADFAGTADGLANVCSVRYCFPKKKASAMSWSGFSGSVTRDEIESALGVIAHVDPLTANGQGNVLSDGAIGQTAYSAALLFEVTGDIRALDWTVALADNTLWLQQQELGPEGTVMWTGQREPVWPTYDLPPHNTTVLQYAGCENGDAAGHMLAPALFILKNPCLYDLVPDFPSTWRGPSPFNSSATYLERAMAYISAGDATVDYFLEYFLDKNDKLIQPDDPRWNLVGDTGNKPGDPMPWNRRFLTLHAFHKLAVIHRHSQALDTSRAELLDKVIQINVADFMADLNSTTTPSGDPAYVWEYTAESETNTEEVEGVHAYFDIWGTFMAWQRFPSLVTDADATIFGNTMQQICYLGDGTFSGLVNGDSDSKAPSVSTLWGAWSFYSLWVDSWWQTVAGANYKHGWGSSVPASVPLLWAKQARYMDSSAFWQGLYNTDDDTVSFTDSDASGDGAQSSAIDAAGVPTATASADTAGATVSVGDPIGGLLSVVSEQVSTVLDGTGASLTTNLVTTVISASPTVQAKAKGASVVVATTVKTQKTKVVTTVHGKVKTLTKTKKITRKITHTKSALHGAKTTSNHALAAASSGSKSTGSGAAASATAKKSAAGALVAANRWDGLGGWISSAVAVAVGAGLFLLN